VSGSSRILTAARMHLVRPMFWLAVPWVILAASLFVSLLAAAVIDNADLDHYGTGGLIFFYAAFGTVYVQAVASVLPLAKGWSLPGRTFYAGTALFAAVQSLAYGVVFYLLLLLERATNGWGVQQPFFTGGWFTPNYSWEVDNPALQVAIFAAPMSWIGYESAVWSGWVKDLEQLASADDLAIRAIAVLALERARTNRDRALAQEHHEAVFGPLLGDFA